MSIELDSTKYVMATVRVPIEISMTGEQTVHSELYEIEYDIIDQLPNVSVRANRDQISTLFSKIADVYDDEIAFHPDYYEASLGESESEFAESESAESESAESDTEDTGPFVPIPTEASSTFMFHVVAESESESESDNDHPKPTIEFSRDIHDEQMVRKDEIRKYKTYPKSTTFRRTRRPPSRFSRKSETRFLQVPDEILREFRSVATDK